MEPAVFGFAKRADIALFLESTVLECIFSLCKAATRTWIAAKGSNAYEAFPVVVYAGNTWTQVLTGF